MSIGLQNAHPCMWCRPFLLPFSGVAPNKVVARPSNELENMRDLRTFRSRTTTSWSRAPRGWGIFVNQQIGDTLFVHGGLRPVNLDPKNCKGATGMACLENLNR